MVNLSSANWVRHWLRKQERQPAKTTITFLFVQARSQRPTALYRAGATQVARINTKPAGEPAKWVYQGLIRRHYLSVAEADRAIREIKAMHNSLTHVCLVSRTFTP